MAQLGGQDITAAGRRFPDPHVLLEFAGSARVDREIERYRTEERDAHREARKVIVMLRQAVTGADATIIVANAGVLSH